MPVLIFLLLATLGGYPERAYAQTLDEARDRGLAWLIANQRNDGSWAATPESAVPTTALALQAFKVAGVKPGSFPYAMALTWMMNAKPDSVDSLARQVASLPVGGPGADERLTALQNAVNPYGGWGAYPGFDTSFPDTPLALAAYRAFGLSFSNQRDTVYCEILPAQLSAGGWGYFKPFGASGPPGIASAALVPTVYNILELKAINTGLGWDSDTCPYGSGGTMSILSAINNGKAFLLTRKNGDGGFGAGGISTVIETALAHLTLRTLNGGDADAAAALNFLLSRQDQTNAPARGSWSGEPFQTALVLSAMPAPATTLVDTDQDGIPDGVELALGSDPNVADSRSLAVGGGSNTVGLSVASSYSAHAVKLVPITTTLTASGGALPYSWSIVSGTLPPGLGVAADTGTISGTPSTVGAFAFTVAVRDALGVTVNFAGNIVVLTNEQMQLRKRDFDGDGKADILWRNIATGENYVYFMDGLTIKPSEGYTQTVSDLGWQLAGRGDVDGDGKADIVWRHATTGGNYVYLMDGLTIRAEDYISTVPDQNWQFVGFGDFDGDGKDDVLGRNSATGENYIYFMDGLTIKPTSGYISSVWDLDWKVAAIGDFDGDGKADIFWRNSAGGQTYLHLMDGLTVKSEDYAMTVTDQNWKVVGVGDFDGDGKADILWRNAATGENYVFFMDGLTMKPTSGYMVSREPSWNVADVGDFDNDARADIFWRNSETGETYIYLMDGLTVKGEGSIRTQADQNWTVVGK